MSEKEGETEKDGPLKAAMSVVLKANNVVVAEIEDHVLWNAVFAAISSGRSGISLIPPAVQASSLPASDTVFAAAVANTPSVEPIDKFAKELGVESAVLEGACSPSTNEPFIEFDLHCWETMKKSLPARGAKAITPIVIAATVTCLWSRHSEIGSVTQAMAKNVLSTIHVQDTNATRGLDACDWIQRKQAGVIVVNPAKISKAIVVAKAFCTQDWSEWRSL